MKRILTLALVVACAPTYLAPARYGAVPLPVTPEMVAAWDSTAACLHLQHAAFDTTLRLYVMPDTEQLPAAYGRRGPGMLLAVYVAPYHAIVFDGWWLGTISNPAPLWVHEFYHAWADHHHRPGAFDHPADPFDGRCGVYPSPNGSQRLQATPMR